MSLRLRRASDVARPHRLLDAAARAGRLRAPEATLAAFATEATDLVGTAWTACATVDGDGTWWGVRHAGGATTTLDPAVATWLAVRRRPGQAAVVEAPEPVRDAVGARGALVVAGAAAEHGVPVVFAVGEEVDDELLVAFAGTCSVAMANARHLDEVQHALRTQVDLNRQKDEFVAAVSHELRNPLAVILGAVQTMRRLGDRVPTTVREEMLGTAEDGGNRLLRMIEDLLLVASAGHRRLRLVAEPVDAVAVLEAVAAEARTAGGPACSVTAVRPLPELVTDQDKLRRIVVNLVENAGKYAPGSPVELAVAADDDGVAITVADHGPGIAAGDRTRVFQPFVQLDQSSTRRQGGTGLGLHLCRTMSDVLGGRLTVGDRPDGLPGAHFTLHLPMTVPAPAAAPGPGPGGHP